MFRNVPRSCRQVTSVAKGNPKDPDPPTSPFEDTQADIDDLSERIRKLDDKGTE